MEDKKYDKEDAYRNLERVNAWISNCDNKASILIAVLGIVIGLTTDIFKTISFFKDIIIGKICPSADNIILLVFLLIGLISLLILCNARYH